MNNKDKEDFLKRYIAILMKSDSKELTLTMPKGVSVEEVLKEMSPKKCGYKLLSCYFMGDNIALITFFEK